MNRARENDAQSQAFIAKAREIGADADQSGADELLGHLHHKRPEPHKKEKRRSTD